MVISMQNVTQLNENKLKAEILSPLQIRVGFSDLFQILEPDPASSNPEFRQQNFQGCTSLYFAAVSD